MGIAKDSQFGVTHYDPSKACEGYTLFASLGDFYAWLIDMEGRIVHAWQLPYRPGQHAKLLPDGKLLYLGRSQDQKGPEEGLGGFGGKALISDWDSNVLWEYSNDYMHHDFSPTSKGNFLVLYWSCLMPKDIEAKIKGGPPSHIAESTRVGAPGKMWACGIQEITPEKKVVWEWRDYEHLDPEIEILGPLDWRSEWLHANAVEELPNEDILLTSRGISAIHIIDKKTGDVKWRFSGDISHPHDASMLENGNILVFDNGMGRINSELCYSRVVEINPRTNKIVWEFKDNPPHEFYSGIQGGCQRLPNGNTLIVESTRGRIFEVTPDCEIVWEFVNPSYGYDLGPSWWNGVRKAFRYSPDYEGLKGKTLDHEKFYWLNKAWGLYKPSSGGKK